MRLLLVSAGLMLASSIALADAHEAKTETGSIVETFSCNYNSGKDADDLWPAVEYYKKQVAKVDSKELKDYFAAVVIPLRASSPSDFGWIGNWTNLNAMARGLDAFYAGPEGAASDKRFASVGKCQSGLWAREPLMTNYPEEDATPDADAVELYLCNLRDGASLEAAASAEQGFISANADAPIALERWTPMFANTPYDLVYLVAHENLSAFASFNTNWQTSKAGQVNGQLFDSIMNCESGLYTGRVVQQGAVE